MSSEPEPTDTPLDQPPSPEVTNAKGEPIHSRFSDGLAAFLTETGISLAITTYQAGQLIIASASERGVDLSFRRMAKPMGLAYASGQLGVGVLGALDFYQNVPDKCPQIVPADAYDACFVPRYAHLTGEIDVHELAIGKSGQIWFINTRFSALCTLRGSSSFAPAWKPPFISALAAEDRCHLNGLGMRDGAPRYVTGLGVSDVRGGWRENKASGGFLMDVSNNQFICNGLSMPHSPRWHANALWVCESGLGRLSTVNPSSGQVKPMFELPGFTRGLDFHGPYAFVGLSKVRESATFSGIPIAEPGRVRECGVCVLDVRDGRIVGQIDFSSGVDEIFSVQVLPGLKKPALMGRLDDVSLQSYFLPSDILSDIKS